ncbi:MAG: hypothetical protein WC313_09555 [Candidatus Kapaibacterium sp.]|jgi:hypothetical protein|nr:hypothetical protein [Candidatus Kapabacteria bacterium]
MLISLLKNNVSRALLYILFFAGILKLSGMLMTWFWNSYLTFSFGLHEITFLESVGILAFFYLVFSGVKFGFNTISAQYHNTDKLSPGSMPQCQSCSILKKSNSLQTINKLSPNEKEMLKAAIAQCCGIRNDSVPIEHKHQVNIPSNIPN